MNKKEIMNNLKLETLNENNSSKESFSKKTTLNLLIFLFAFIN